MPLPVLEFAVYFRSRTPPSIDAWRAALQSAQFPITIADGFDFFSPEEFTEAEYDGWSFDFRFTLGDPDPQRPPEVRDAQSVAVFRPSGEFGNLNATVALAAAFAVATEGWMLNCLSGELSEGSDAIEYARWFATLPEDSES